MRRVLIALASALIISGAAFAQSAGEKESGLAAVYSNKLHGHISIEPDLDAQG
jgi:hypothetical protein